MTISRSWETLRTEVHGHTALLTLNRPDRLNAINPTMLSELEEFWTAFDADPTLRAAVVTGEGERAFCSGADVATVADKSRARTSVFERENRFTPLQARVRKPTICAVNGVCAGGGLHFVADTDFSIASETATFTDPHVSVGQVSAIESIVLSRRIPHQALMRMVLLGRHERIDAEHALRMGLVTEVVADASLVDRALELADVVAHGSPAAIAASREAIWGAQEGSLRDSLQYAWALLRAHGDHHPDAQEGPRAFFEKRAADWADL